MAKVNIEIIYKYQGADNYFSDKWDSLTNEQADRIAKRFMENMKIGDYAELQIKITNSK